MVYLFYTLKNKEITKKGREKLSIEVIAIRLLIAITIGGAVGYERKYNNRPAGFRTHILVCVGAAVISMIQLNLMHNILEIGIKNPNAGAVIKTDLGRLGAQVISGVGFLGAGTIIREKGSVKGLTTAASLWVVACIGLAVGWGFYSLSIMAAVCVVITLVSLKKFENKFLEKNNLYRMRIDYSNQSALIGDELQKYFLENKIKVKNIEYLIEDDEEYDDEYDEEHHKGSNHVSSVYTILVPRSIRIVDLLTELGNIDELDKVFLI